MFWRLALFLAVVSYSADACTMWTRCLDPKINTLCYTDCYAKQYLTSQGIKFSNRTSFQGVSRACIDTPGSLTTLMNDLRRNEGNNCQLLVLDMDQKSGEMMHVTSTDGNACLSKWVQVDSGWVRSKVSNCIWCYCSYYSNMYTKRYNYQTRQWNFEVKFMGQCR